MSKVQSPKLEKKIIGLTGPVAAGKDAVAKILAKLGAFVIDADKLAHTLYSPKSKVYQSLVKTFGKKMLAPSGKISRKKLGEIVFADKAALTKLNRIVHPALKREIIKIVEKLIAESCKPFIIINAAVLKEIGLIPHVDEVWVVLASREKRLKRLIKKGLSKEKALKRINSQAPQKDYLKMADVVIRNEGTLKQLYAQIQTQLKI